MASQLILATTSTVSSDAKAEFDRVIPWRLDFIERQTIMYWCLKNGGVVVSG